MSHTATDSHEDRGHMSSQEIHMDEGCVSNRAVMLMGVCAVNCQRTLMQDPQRAQTGQRIHISPQETMGVYSELRFSSTETLSEAHCYETYCSESEGDV